MSKILALLAQLNELASLDERSMSPYHKEKIAAAHRGNRQSAQTKKKISRSMEGKSNFEGKKHTDHARDVIGAKRGSDDRIRGRRWIVNRADKTYRRYHAPGGYKIGRRKYEESICSFKDFFLD